MSNKQPSSILIIGSGVFGLSTAYELTQVSAFSSSTITVVDRSTFPTPDGASIDSSRIVRSDYADPAYAHLGAFAQQRWRSEWGANGRYHETGLVFVSNEGEENETYIKKSLENVQSIIASAKSKGNTAGMPDIEVLSTPDEVTNATNGESKGFLGPCGSFGYLNRRSGWADAEAAMTWLHQQVAATGRVRFVTGTAQKLLFSSDGKSVQGAVLKDGSTLNADITVLAAGSWTPTLCDLRGIVQCTAQTLAYIPLSPSEAATFKNVAVQFNLSNGIYILPPPENQDLLTEAQKQNLHIKFARHFHGYLNPTTIPHPEPHNANDKSSPTITISVPCSTPLSTFPASASDPLRDCAKRILPADIANRPFSQTRLCHYSDTPTGDFLVDWHPSYNKSLFIATGGSGHGYKFLPVMGEAIVRCLLGNAEIVNEKWIINDETMQSLKGQWAWRQSLGLEKPWYTDDGSRSGKIGAILVDELK